VAVIERHREKPDSEASYRHIGDRDIINPVDKWFVHFEIVIRETPISGGQLSAHQG
jgi:hypothetical protein